MGSIGSVNVDLASEKRQNDGYSQGLIEGEWLPEQKEDEVYHKS
jgi:hypothetical protein